MMIRCCLALFGLLMLAACGAPAEGGDRNAATFQVPAGGGGGY